MHARTPFRPCIGLRALSDPVEETGRLDAQAPAQPHEGREARLTRGALQAADLGWVDAAAQPQGLLAQLCSDARLAQVLSEDHLRLQRVETGPRSQSSRAKTSELQ